MGGGGGGNTGHGTIYIYIYIFEDGWAFRELEEYYSILAWLGLKV